MDENAPPALPDLPPGAGVAACVAVSRQYRAALGGSGVVVEEQTITRGPNSASITVRQVGAIRPYPHDSASVHKQAEYGNPARGK